MGALNLLNIDNLAFQRIIVIALFTFFMVMYVVSFITGKQFVLQDLLAFIVPVVNFVVHVYSSTSQQNTSMKTSGTLMNGKLPG